MLELDAASELAFLLQIVPVGNCRLRIVDVDDFGQAGKESLNVIDDDPDVAHRVRNRPDE
ncbi:hypothetical protein D3C73_1267250 [compost metagenome]